MQQRLLPEWAPQAAVLLTWPHKDTDWWDIITEAEQVYVSLAYQITRFSALLIAAPPESHPHIQTQLRAGGVPLDKVRLYGVSSNDTWARDHGPLTVETPDGLALLDFEFNGWGNKFDAVLDNRISLSLAEQGAFSVPLLTQSLVLEGGAIETDGVGTLLVTEACLLNPNRNPGLNRAQIESSLETAFGVRKINWLRHGYLDGDDTDSHIDTLARLCPHNRIAYVSCDDPGDSHYQALLSMQEELIALSNADGQSYELIALPWPAAKYSVNGERLPATYANFLILNGAVLVPIYSDDKDAQALDAIARAFPGYEIVGINCLALIEQHGSLHCVTMQLPEGVL